LSPIIYIQDNKHSSLKSLIFTRL